MPAATAPEPDQCRVCQPRADKLDIRADRRVAELAAKAWGVLSLDELRACGLTRDGVTVRVRNGQLHRLYRGVYAVGHPNLPLQGLFLAALKACGPTAVLSHFAAAALYALVKWDGRCPEVTVPGTTTRTHRGIVVHRSSRLDKRDTTCHYGIPITTPARTLIDLAACLEYKPLRRAVREAQSSVTNVPQILNALDRLGPRRGTANLTKILVTGPAPTRSELEDTVLELILAGGLEHPEVNRPMIIAGRRVIPDFRWPSQRLVIEADGAEWHDNPTAREDDAERQAILEAHGERVLRVTWQQAVTRRPETLERIRAAGAPTYTLEPR